MISVLSEIIVEAEGHNKEAKLQVKVINFMICISYELQRSVA